MGTLRDLENSNKNVHMYLSKSSSIDLYIYDTLKAMCKASLDDIVEVKSNNNFNHMLEILNMDPFMADKWLITITYSSVKALLKKRVGILESKNACFLVKVKNYGEFKEFKDLYPNVNDLYLSVIRHNDVMFLLKPYNISESLIDFVAKSYSREPEKVFNLYRELVSGGEFNSRKSIVDVLGASTGSVNYFALQLLRDPPTTERGLKTTYRNRIKTAHDLASAYGLQTFKNFLTASVKDIIAVKDMYIAGDIYDKIKDVPDCYDAPRLSRYNPFLDTINQIPYARVMKLYITLKQGGIWRSHTDLLQFLYEYYGGVN